MKPLVSIVVITRNRDKDLRQCLESLVKQDYKPIEVIVIDNASDIPVAKWVRKDFPKVRVFRSEINTGGAGGRNIGIEKARGNYLVFIDDDAFADKSLVKYLYATLQIPSCGVVQPKIYDKDNPEILQGVGHGFNFLTGRVYGIGTREKDLGQYDKEMEIPMAGCTWMTKKSVLQKVGSYDEDLFIPYEDSDFSWRVRKAGYKVILSPKAKVWHQGLKVTNVPKRLQWFGITTPDKAYRVSRNKIIFMKKHAPFLNLIVFIIIFLPIYCFIHSVVIIFSNRFDILGNYWKGILSGIAYLASH